MSLPRPISQRKAASAFISDDTDRDLIEFSPQKKPCCTEQTRPSTPFAMTSNQESITNFIRYSPLNNDKHRALIVSKTGERHSVDVDTKPITKSNPNALTLNSPRYSLASMERISEKSSTQLSLTEKSSKIKSKTAKKPKHIKQQHRLQFIPRNIKSSVSAQLLPAAINAARMTPKVANSQHFAKPLYNSTETQTEYNTCNKVVNTNTCMNYIPMEGPENSVELLRRYQRLNAIATPPPLKPLKLYSKRKYFGKSELLKLAAALAFITVACCLYTTFFDTEYLWDYLDSSLQYCQDWFLTQEKPPKTKVEILIGLLQDLWS